MVTRRRAQALLVSALLIGCTPADGLTGLQVAEPAATPRSSTASESRVKKNEENHRAFLARLEARIPRGPAARAVTMISSSGEQKRLTLEEVHRLFAADFRPVRAGSLTPKNSFAPSKSSYPTSAASADVIPIRDDNEDPNALPQITRASTVVIGGAHGGVAAVVGWNSWTIYSAENATSVSWSRPPLSLRDEWSTPVYVGMGPDRSRPFELFSEWQINGSGECEVLHASTAHRVKSFWSGENAAGSGATWDPRCQTRVMEVGSTTAPDGGETGVRPITVTCTTYVNQISYDGVVWHNTSDPYEICR